MVAKKVLLGWVVSSLAVAPAAQANIIINEVSPSSNPEWVELYNNGDVDVDLTGWTLVDKADHIKGLAGSIGPNSYFVYENAIGWLNDNGDEELALYDSASPSGQLIQQMAYSFSVEAEESLIYDAGQNEWVRNEVVTKNGPNPTPTPIPTVTPTLAPEPTSTPAAPTATNVPPGPTATNTPTPAPSATPKPTPTKSPTPAPIPTAFDIPITTDIPVTLSVTMPPPSGVVAGARAEQEAQANPQSAMLGWILIVVGVVGLGVAGGLVYRYNIKHG